MLFQVQDNYVNLYRYVDNFLALYLMLGSAMIYNDAQNITLTWKVIATPIQCSSIENMWIGFP
jgi:hypothetical protein